MFCIETVLRGWSTGSGGGGGGGEGQQFSYFLPQQPESRVLACQGICRVWVPLLCLLKKILIVGLPAGLLSSKPN
jgi:hypothetical protein